MNDPARLLFVDFKAMLVKLLPYLPQCSALHCRPRDGQIVEVKRELVASAGRNLINIIPHLRICPIRQDRARRGPLWKRTFISTKSRKHDGNVYRALHSVLEEADQLFLSAGRVEIFDV